MKNLPVCLGQVAVEIAACYKIHVIDKIIRSCSKTTEVKDYAQCSDEINSS